MKRFPNHYSHIFSVSHPIEITPGQLNLGDVDIVSMTLACNDCLELNDNVHGVHGHCRWFEVMKVKDIISWRSRSHEVYVDTSHVLWDFIDEPHT